MSALTIAATRPALDVAALRADLYAVLEAHGLGTADVLNVDVNRLTQAGANVGVSISAMAWSKPTPPAELVALQGGAS